MSLTDDTHAAARTLAILTHMTKDQTMRILDLLVHMDQQAIATISEQERNTVGAFPTVLAALCSSELAKVSPVCRAPERKVNINPMTGQRTGSA